MEGTVNPKGGVTGAHFEYGLTTDYGLRTPTQAAGFRPQPVGVNHAITNLRPDTIYHFRLVAANAGGTHAGADQAFTTLDLPSFAVLGAPAEPAWNLDVQAKLLGTGLMDTVDLFPVSALPTLAQLQQYPAVLLYVAGSSFFNETAVGNVLADYVDQGGGLVLSAHSSGGAPGFRASRLYRGGYMPFTMGFVNAAPLTMVKDHPEVSLFDGVASLESSMGYHDAPVSTTNAFLLAHWNTGQPLVAIKDDVKSGRVVGLNFMPASSDMRPNWWDTRTAGARLMANALLWAAATRPIIDTAPADQTAMEGLDATFQVAATSLHPPLGYQWHFNGTNLVGETNATLTILNAQPANAGRYTVMISDRETFTVTAPARLNVTPFIAPALSHPVRQEGRFSVTVATPGGLTCVLESKDRLTDPEWQGVSRTPGNGQAQVLTDVDAIAGQRFYRVRLE